MASRTPTSLDHIGRSRLPLRRWRSESLWYRIHRTGQGAAWFGPKPGTPPLYRFDDPSGEYRTCYLGVTVEASFAETLLRNPPRRHLALSDLAERSITTFRLQHDLRLVQLHSDGLAKLGLTADMVHGTYEECGQLARALWEHADAPDGIEYRSRHDDEQLCLALFDRAADSIVVEATEGLMEDVPRLQTILRRYGVGLRR